MGGAVEDVKNFFSDPGSLVAPLVSGPAGQVLQSATSAPDIGSPGYIPPPKYKPGTDAEDFASRQRAASAASLAPGSATSILTDESDPLGIKRQRLLGL